MSTEDSDLYHCYVDMWKSSSGQINMACQSIGKANTELAQETLSAGAEDQAVAGAFGSRFCIPLDFELLEPHMLFYQSGLGDRLEYELTFSAYNKVINATDTDSSYVISNICLEFGMIIDSKLARQIKHQFSGRMAILYDRNLRHRNIAKNISDSL